MCLLIKQENLSLSNVAICICKKQLSAVRLFSGADFIPSEFTDIRTAASGITGVSWERLGGIMNRAVKRGLERRGDIPPLIIGLDEKQVFSRHRYFTIVTDPVNHCVYDVITDGRAKKHIEYWFQEHKAMLSKVEKATMDMSASYYSLTAEYMPNATVCFDHYHVIAIMNKAVDEVRKTSTV